MTVTFEFWAPRFGDLRVTAERINGTVWIRSVVSAGAGYDRMDRPMSARDRARLHRAALDAFAERDDETCDRAAEEVADETREAS
jgi:hypothetical protein